MWGRYACYDTSSDPTCASFTCSTMAGNVPIDCTVGPTKGHTTLFEIHFGRPHNPTGSGALDYYDISLVDAFNVPMNIVPVPGSYYGEQQYVIFTLNKLMWLP